MLKTNILLRYRNITLVAVFPPSESCGRTQPKDICIVIDQLQDPTTEKQEENWIQMSNKYVIHHFDDKFSINTVSNMKAQRKNLTYFDVPAGTHILQNSPKNYFSITRLSIIDNCIS